MSDVVGWQSPATCEPAPPAGVRRGRPNILAFPAVTYVSHPEPRERRWSQPNTGSCTSRRWCTGGSAAGGRCSSACWRDTCRAGHAPPRLLDFGCGTGGNAVGYAALGPVVGVEPDREALRFAALAPRGRRRHRLDYCRAGGTALPLRNAQLRRGDRLGRAGAHRGRRRRRRGEIARVLRPGGVFIFSVPAHPWLWSAHDVALWHQRRLPPPGAGGGCSRGAGLRLRWLSYWNTALFPAVAAPAGAGARARGTRRPPRIRVLPVPVRSIAALTGILLRRGPGVGLDAGSRSGSAWSGWPHRPPTSQTAYRSLFSMSCSPGSALAGDGAPRAKYGTHPVVAPLQQFVRCESHHVRDGGPESPPIRRA